MTQSQSASNRELDLWRASQKYVSGQITMEEFEEIEQSYNEDFNGAVLEISKRAQKPGLIRALLRLLKPS